MTEWFWRRLAAYCARPEVFARIVERALATPYGLLKRAEGRLYMARYWFFNGYVEGGHGKRWPLLPSIRVHFIAEADEGPPHDHPWRRGARTIILRGWYLEERNGVPHMRVAGTTATIAPGEFHKITAVGPKGCWTLFFMFGEYGSWGFQK